MDGDTAAIIIQASVRRYLARRIYSQKLLDKFQKDEAVRLEKEQQQVCEGEMLVKRYKLQTEIAELETVTANNQRRENVMATRIQRAWRDYTRTTLTPSPPKQHSQQDDCTSVRAVNDSCVVSSTKIVVENNGAQVDQSGDYHISGMAAKFKRRVWEPLQHSNYELGSTPTLRTGTPVSFETKYTLCFTSDLSESSEEEQELVTNKCTSSYSTGELEDEYSNGREEHWPSIDAEVDDSYMLSIEKKFQDLVSTANDLIFEDEFEDGSFSERDNLSDNITLRTDDVSIRSTPESTPSKGSAVANSPLHTVHHRNNPLYTMTLTELREFLKQIKSKMKVASKELMGLLIQRDQLRTENTSLHQNVAKLEHTETLQQYKYKAQDLIL